MAHLLQPVQRVDPAQLLREQWETAVRGVDLMKIVGFVRESPTLRNDDPSCQAMNGVFLAIGEIQKTGQDLTAGTIKTLEDCRAALLSTIAATNYPEFSLRSGIQTDSYRNVLSLYNTDMNIVPPPSPFRKLHYDGGSTR